MTKNKYPFKGKVVLVTGGGSGIGRAIAKAFLDNDATVVVIGRRLEPLEETVSSYPKDRTLVISKDISLPTSAGEIISEILSKFGHLDVVVSNAGVYANGELEDLADNNWEKMRAINVDGLFYLAKAVYKPLLASKGNLVAISSVSGIRGDWNQAGYNATKFAVTGFVQSLALDWGEKGVRVNGVAPAFTLTDMNKGVAQDKDKLKQFTNRIALDRPGYPEDIAPAVLFLASPDASYINGAILPVDGGTSASTGQPHVVD